jgi:hypothetical protein
MSTVARTQKELGEALKSNASEIVIEGKLSDGRVIKIRAVGPVAWAVAIGGIGISVAAIIVSVGSGGSSSFVTVPGAVVGFATAAGVLGVGAAATAIAISVAAGGVGALTKLRQDYRIEKRNGKTILIRK